MENKMTIIEEVNSFMDSAAFTEDEIIIFDTVEGLSDYLINEQIIDEENRDDIHFIMESTNTFDLSTNDCYVYIP